MMGGFGEDVIIITCNMSQENKLMPARHFVFESLSGVCVCVCRIESVEWFHVACYNSYDKVPVLVCKIQQQSN